MCTEGKEGETKTGERCKVQKRVRNGRVIESSRPLPTTARTQTAGHTQAAPPGDQESCRREAAPRLLTLKRGADRAQGPNKLGWPQ